MLDQTDRNSDSKAWIGSDQYLILLDRDPGFIILDRIGSDRDSKAWIGSDRYLILPDRPTLSQIESD
jgi:hypothetical protein